jgi:quercetin dioxygenase-like cupin family protein
MRRLGLFCVVGVLLGAAYAAVDEDGFVRIMMDEITFEDAGSGSPQITLIYGDPEQEGFYLLRARFAPGVFSTPHYHSTERHVTVIKGTWYTGTGENFDRDDTVGLSPGSYMMHPAGAIHYDGAKDEEVIVEIKGIGPATTVRVQ